MRSSVLTDFELAPFDIIDGDRGKNYPKQNEFASEGHCLFLSATTVTKNGFDFSNCQFISEQKDAALRKGKLRRGDVVLTTRGTIGNSAYYSDVIQYDHVRINSGMVILRCDTENILPVYLYHFLRSPYFFGQVNSLRSGVAQPQLPIRDMKKIKLPLPSVKVQSQISSVLSTYDDLIENNRRRIQLLEQAARLLYKEWFVHLRFPGHEHTKIIDGLPEGWDRTSINELATVYRGKSYKSSELRDKGGRDFVNLKCIKRFGGFRSSGIKRFEGEHKDHHRVQPGDIVMAVTDMTRDAMIVAQAGRVPREIREGAIYSMDIVKIVPAPDIEPSWLYSLFRYSDFSFVVREHATGTNVLHLKPKYIEEWSTPLPPAALRRAFADAVDPILNQADLLELQNSSLAKARDLLLPQLMNGEVAV